MTKYTVANDGGDWIVISTESRAKSFAMVPTGHTWRFIDRDAAVAQTRALSGIATTTRMTETPDRFEAVEDLAYGPAWA